MTTLEVHKLSKRYPGSRAPAVKDVSFSLQNGEILALVGPSGCGKTTTLRLIAGLERPDSGVITLKGQVVASPDRFVPPERRGVGMVFQEHALFPHLRVFENVAFGLRQPKSPEARQVVMEILAMVGLQDLAGRYPHALSGGERQRAALARALAPRPVLVLMDEPFSSLDADLRSEMRVQVRKILKSMHATVIFVTHDQEEALYMGDRLAVFQQGQIEQIGSPEEIFHASHTHFVAEFMGSSDFLSGETRQDGIQTAIGTLPQALGLPAGTPVDIAVRADDVDFSPDEGGNAEVAERIFRGAFYVYQLRLASGELLHALKLHTQVYEPGMRVNVFFNAGHPLEVFREGKSVVHG